MDTRLLREELNKLLGYIKNLDYMFSMDSEKFVGWHVLKNLVDTEQVMSYKMRGIEWVQKIHIQIKKDTESLRITYLKNGTKSISNRKA